MSRQEDVHKLSVSLQQRRGMLFWVFVSCLVGALNFSSIHAQSTQSTDVDLDSAERHFGAQRVKPSLHTRDSFPDGAKGFISPLPQGLQVQHLQVPPEFKSKGDWRDYLAYCRADAIVVGKFLNSTPVLMTTKASVYTVSHFSVSQIIKADEGLALGQTIVTYRSGGEVMDDGEKLRVDVPDAPPYKMDGSYLLLLTREKNAGARQYSTPDFGTISVRKGRVYSSSGDWAGFLSGASYAEVEAAFDRVAKIKECSR